ncbi:chemotaxis protein [Shewanella algidipiscicola]|uniref:chemotaxis protein n=1 Tax=Shewanella algidipiscicola TaxID=614070 RepID=UPI000D78B6DD|nr:chemotaxis protein [Shewanella algidipiscicola]
MQIPSSFASGLSGLQSAQSGLTQATVDVAKPATSNTSASTTDTYAPVAQTDKTHALVSSLESLNQAEAATEVIALSSETLGTVIDIKV